MRNENKGKKFGAVKLFCRLSFIISISSSFGIFHVAQVKIYAICFGDVDQCFLLCDSERQMDVGI